MTCGKPLMWWAESTIQSYCALLTQLSSFQLGKLGLILMDTSEVTQQRRWRWSWEKPDSHCLCFSHILCLACWWVGTPQCKRLPNWTWNLWGSIRSSGWVIFHQWGLLFKAAIRLARPHYSPLSLFLRHGFENSQWKFVSKVSRIQLDKVS